MADEEIKERDELIAVIVADSFTKAFWPITKDMPKVLLPVCNIPLIEYTIELVIRNHIKKIVIFGCYLSQKVMEYIQTQKYRQVSIQFISRPACISLGDVMRELHTTKLLQNDFLVIYGDTVGNANLKEAIDQHKAVRVKNKEYIVSIVFSELHVKSKLRTEQEQCVVVLEGSRIVQYDGIGAKKKVDLNSNVKFKELKEFEVRHDLVESGVIICSPELMHYFSDNFDYHSLRDHLMKDILTSEIYTDKFMAYVLPKHNYLHRVQVPRSYDAVSVDIMNRWLYPICLNANLFPPSTPSTYISARNNLYKELNVHLAKGVRIETPAVIGTGTIIKEAAVVSMSSIGRNCKIGAGSKITNSYIWNNVDIGENCVLSNAILCSGAVVGSNCVINSGSIISFNVWVNPNTIIKEKSRISLYQYNSNAQEYQFCNEPSEIGHGFLYNIELEHLAQGTFTEKDLENQSIGGILNWIESESENSQISDSESSSSDEPGVEIEKFMPTESKIHLEFIEEIKSLVCEMVERDEDVDSMQIEINSFKFSQNKDFFACITGILLGIIESATVKINLHFEKWSQVLDRYISSDAERLHTLKELDRLIGNRAESSQFHLIVKVLYEKETIDEDCILAWDQSCQNEALKDLVFLM